MTEVVYKPSGSDIFIGAMVSVVASLTFLPLTGTIAVLVSEVLRLNSATSTGLLVVLSALTSILFFRMIWNNSVKTIESTDDSKSKDMESSESDESSEVEEE